MDLNERLYYDCFYVVARRVDNVGRDVLDRVAALGFTVTCRTDAHTVELIGARGGTMFYADILAGIQPGRLRALAHGFTG